MIIKIIKVHPKAIIPTKEHSQDAGYDVYACEDIVLKAGGTTHIDIGIAIEVPKEYYTSFVSRSGLRKKGIWPPENVVDSGYRGSLGVILYNSTHQDYFIKTGDRIAQLIVKPAHTIEFKQVDILSPSERGEKGFGSSGK